MPQQIRLLNPEKHHLTGSRTYQERLLMLPTPEIERIIGGVVARYQELFQVDIFDLNFLSNHSHMLARAPKGNLWKFQMNVKREIARRVNRHLGRRGSLWGTRYSSFEVLDAEADGLQALLYITTNAVNHGLVDHPKNWPGLNGYWQLLTGKERKFKYTHWTAYNRARFLAGANRDSVRIEDYQTEHTLKLTPLPQLAGMSQKERRRFLERKIEERVEEIREKRQLEGKGFLGRKNVLAQHPESRGKSTKRTRKPCCYTKNSAALSDYKDYYWGIRRWYTEMSERFRSGEYDVEFPPHTFVPGTFKLALPPDRALATAFI